MPERSVGFPRFRHQDSSCTVLGERCRWDETVVRRHYLGFRMFAGRFRAFQDDCDEANGRIELSGIKVMTPLPGLSNYLHFVQISRAVREPEEVKSGKKNVETANGITSVAKDRGCRKRVVSRIFRTFSHATAAPLY